MADVETDRWVDIHRIASTMGPLVQESFEGGADTVEFLHEARILVIGAGGLGCELLKNLALSGFKQIDVIDLDTVDVTNLNRQFLFRPTDVGKPKALAAAEFVNRRVPGAKVTPHFTRIEKIEDEIPGFYRQFQVVVCGLDSVPARRWINNKLMSMIQLDEDGQPDPSSIIPMIDGGSEEFKGQARIIIPGATACYECSTDTLVKEEDPMHVSCTVATTPRNAGHCVQYVAMVQWQQEFPDRELDKDSPEDMQWIFERAAKRAAEFKIEGVTLQLTQGVVKRIIPAIASTNAVVAAACANEVFKYVTGSGLNVDDYMFFNGQTGVNTNTLKYARKRDCPICSQYLEKKEVIASRHQTLQSLIEQLNVEFKTVSPSLRADRDTLYTPGPPALEAATRPNLGKMLGELVPQSGTSLALADANKNINITVLLKYKD